MMRRTFATALLAVAVLGGCGSKEETVDLDNTTWTASSLSGSPAQSTITAIFTDGTISGTSGCNQYRGDYETSGSTITFPSPIISTLMACDEEIMAEERTYLQALETVTAYETGDGVLTLLSEDGSAVISFDKVSQEIDETRWSLFSYLDNQARVRPLPDVATEIIFEDDQVSGNVGCNSFHGDYTAGDGQLTVNELMTTDIFCTEPEGVMDQEAAVHRALSAAAEYRIAGDRMTIWDSSGTVILELERP